MREIKFRAWFYRENRMLDWAELNDGTESLLTIFNNDISDVSPAMQFIGLYDKNGKEIYEDDIVKKRAYNGTEYDLISVVVFDEGGFCLKCISGNEKSGTGFLHSFSHVSGNCVKSEVIGNRFQNPEFQVK
jgi:uncharacterized phage protein (TIGR01671 family)